MLKKLSALEVESLDSSEESNAPGALEAIDAPDSLSEGAAPLYLLLETEAVEKYLRDQVLAAKRKEIADRETAEEPTDPDNLEDPEEWNPIVLADEIVKRDGKAAPHWVWRETIYDEYATTGPMLVQIQADSPLCDVFLKEWSASDGVVVIKTAAPLEDVLGHLRAILFVYLPDNSLGRFRLQETLALAYVLRSLSADRADSLLGPLQELVWRERMRGIETGEPAKFQWWRYHRSKTDYNALRNFRLTEKEMRTLDELLAQRDQRAAQATEKTTEQTSTQAQTKLTQENKHNG
jgi:hypothetical protein